MHCPPPKRSPCRSWRTVPRLLAAPALQRMRINFINRVFFAAWAERLEGWCGIWLNDSVLICPTRPPKEVISRVGRRASAERPPRGLALIYQDSKLEVLLELCSALLSLLPKHWLDPADTQWGKLLKHLKCTSSKHLRPEQTPSISILHKGIKSPKIA